jgi:O-antigen/teichoic acid export membrane protein
MTLHVLAMFVAFVTGAVMLYRSRPAAVKHGPPPRYQPRIWLATVLPLAMTQGSNLINQYADILLLGLMREDAEVGIYRVVLQGAILVTFFLQSIDMVLQPLFVRLYTRGETQRLQRLVTLCARAILLFALLVWALYIVAGREILGFVFGDGFREGYTALVILGLAQLIKAAAGPVGTLLNMTGHERYTMRVVLLAAVVNVVLNVVLIPQFGMLGAASAFAVSLTVWSVVLVWICHRRLGIGTTALGVGARK